MSVAFQESVDVSDKVRDSPQCLCTTPCSTCVLLGSLVDKATNLHRVDS